MRCSIRSADITYVPMTSGFLCLVATTVCFSRLVVSWRLSNSLESEFCLAMLKESLAKGSPGIFNTDQGCAVYVKCVDESIGIGGCEGEHGWRGSLPR